MTQEADHSMVDGEVVKLLDHGYVKLMDFWGTDETIIEAARMSTGKGFQGWGPVPCRKCGMTDEEVLNRGAAGDQCPDGENHDMKGDEKLLAYLWKNKHHTPFEMVGATFEVQAPIFVFREWHRHRTQSYNEASARYAPLPAFDYVPTVERLMLGGGHLTKQAGAHGDAALTEDLAAEWRRELAEVYDHAERVYQKGLGIGVPKELARLSMTVGRYSKMRASTDLRNWIGFLNLRDDKHAQFEIQAYAREGVRALLTKVFPRAMALYAESKP